MFSHRMFKKVEVPRMPLEDLMQKILSSRPDITHEELQKMINAKMEEAKGFLTQESAVRVVAAELGIEPPRTRAIQGIMIKDLVSGLSDVTVTARVIFVGPIQRFTSPDGREGRMRHLIAADKTGELRVVLWDDKADLTDSSSLLDQIVQFTHGYVRSIFDGRLELNIGSKGSLEFPSPDMFGDEIPLLIKYHRRIEEITKDARTVNVIGSVVEVYSVSSFSREDGSEGMLRKIELQDETGMILVVVWNTKVQELADIKVGSLLQMFGAKVKESLDGGVELHADSSVGTALLEELPLGYEGLSTNHARIRDLKPSMRVTVEGRVATQPLIREVTTSKKEKVKLASFELEDETGRISVSLWRDFAALAESLLLNEKIRLRRVHVDHGSLGGLILSSSSETVLDRI
jgi:ssDNA-binding replication factor A large subunit